MTSLTMLRFLTQKLKSQSINESQPYNKSIQLKDDGTESGTEAEDEKAARLECRTLSAGNPQSIDGEPEQTVLGTTDYDGRFNSLLHITQQQPTRHNSRLPCNSYFQLHQQQQQHHHHQLQRSDYATTMERSLITEEDVKMEELQLSEDECQKENQLEQLQPQQIEEQKAMLQSHSHHHNHHHSQEQQQQQQYQCDPKHTDVLLSENKMVIPASSPSSSSLEVVEIAPAVSPQTTLNQQAALPSTLIHPLSSHEDAQLSISPSLSFDSEGEQQENKHHQQQQHTASALQQQQLKKNEEGTKSAAAERLDQEYNVSDDIVETTDSPLNQVTTRSTCLNNSVNSETATNLSNLISISTDVPDSNTNTAVAGDLIGPKPSSVDRPNELASLTEQTDVAMTTRSPDEVNRDQSLPVSLESQSPVSMVTATSPSVVVDQHSSEEELECINQENSHPEKRKWSQMESQSSNSVESNHPKSNIYHSFHPPHHHHHHNNHHQLHHPLSPHHHNNHQQSHHILHHQQQSNINHNQQHRSSSSSGSSNSGNNGGAGNNNNNNNNNNNAINSQQHCHNHNNNQHNCSSSSGGGSNNNNNNSNNSILINNSNICNNNNNNNNNINNNSNMNNNNNNSCCFTDSAGSSDEEVKEFMLDPKPILFSSAPPSGIQKVMRSSSANFLVPNGPPLSICAISPRKRHRLNSSSDSLDLENISVIQRPCLDFEKMQKTLMRKHTSHSVSRAKIVKIKTISGNGTSSKCWFDPAVCSFRSISTAYSPLPPVEEPSCAY